MLTLLDSVALPANPVDEDAAGHLGGWAWVLDGATPIRSAVRAFDSDSGPVNRYDEQPEASAAARLVAAASAELRAVVSRSPDAEARHVVRQVIHAVCNAQLSNTEPASACLGLAHSGNGHLDYLLLGDVTIAVVNDDGAQVVEDPDALSREREQLERAGDDAAALAEVLRDQRSAMNTPNGYWILADDPAAVDHARTGQLPAAAGDHVLLATDGFARLVDVFGRYQSWQALVTDARTRGLRALGADLRQLETADADRSRYPRVKPHDDATAMLLQVVD